MATETSVSSQANMLDYIISFEAFWTLISFLIARMMVQKGKGFAKCMPVGKDDERTIKEMKSIAANLVKDGKLKLENISEDFDVNVIIVKGAIEKVEIKTPRTRIICDLVKSEKRISHTGGYKKIEAILLTTICVWLMQVPLQLIALIAYVLL